MSGFVHSFKNTLMSVGPVAVIIFILQAFFAPMSMEMMARFLIGTVFLVIGLSIFDVGVSAGMEPLGEEIGAAMTGAKKLWVVLITGFAIGFSVTIAEPDLKVLTGQVDAVSGGLIPPNVLMISVAIGVGILTVIALLRILLQWPLRYLLWIIYGIIFVMAIITPTEFIPVSFDSGGVTTGPMTVPFILSLGVGVSSIRSDKNADSDSFGLVGLVSAGPILALLILGVLLR